MIRLCNKINGRNTHDVRFFFLIGRKGEQKAWDRFDRNGGITVRWDGIPIGVPEEFKMINGVAAGFTTFFIPWGQIAKNFRWINLLHFSMHV